jgi:hypothetical protein
MAIKLSKIGSMLGQEAKSLAGKAKASSSDIVKNARERAPRALFNTFGGSEIHILESAFSLWEEKRNAKMQSKAPRSQAPDKSGIEMVNEARKSRQDAKETAQQQKASQDKTNSIASANADQATSQIRVLTVISNKLEEIKGILKVGGKTVGGKEKESGGGIFGTIWNLLPQKLKGKLGGKAAEIAEKVGGKRIGSLVKLAAATVGATAVEKVGAEVVEKSAASAAGAGIGAAAKSIAPEAAGSVVAHASGGIMGKIGGMGRSALGAAGGVIDSGKTALGKAWGATGGKLGGMFKGGAKSVEKLGAEAGGKEAEKVGAEAIGKEGEKIGGKLLLKEGAKAIPLLGNIIGLGTNLAFAGKRLWEGDAVGAGLEAGSGLLNLIPGVGNYLSIAADVGIAGRDLKRAHQATQLAQAAEAAKTGKAVAATVGEGATKIGEKGTLKGTEEGVKGVKEISEEAAKVIEEKADQTKDDAKDKLADAKSEKPEKKEPSMLAKLGSAINPIGTADATETHLSPGKIAGITGAGAAMVAATVAAGSKSSGPAPLATKTVTASPMDKLVAYMEGLFELASDDTQGLYVRMSKAPFQDASGQKKDQPATPAAPASQPDATGTASPGSISTSNGGGDSSAPSSSLVASPSSGGPAADLSSGGGSMDAASGAATNSGFVDHAGGAPSGKLHLGGPATESTAGSVGGATKSYGKAGSFDIDSMWDSMKETIAGGESGKAGYDAHHGGTINGLTNMTIGQLKKMKGAMGKYQMLPGSTLGEAAKGAGLSDSDTFSAANQEAMGKFLFARRVKQGAKGGAAGVQSALAHEWASLPVDATGKGAYDGDAAGNMAAGGSARGSAIGDMISGSTKGSMAGVPSNTANSIDSATQDVAKNSTDGAPVVIPVQSGGGGGAGGGSAPGTGSGLSGPMVTRNSDSSVQAITQNFMAGSSAAT